MCFVEWCITFYYKQFNRVFIMNVTKPYGTLIKTCLKYSKSKGNNNEDSVFFYFF